MEFRILGPLEVVAAGGEVLALGSAQQRALLALLVVRAPELVSRGRLVDELWGERPPATAEHAVQVHVSGIRKALRVVGDGVVRSAGQGYVIDVDPDRIDARRFERLVGEAHQVLADDPSRGQALFDEALRLWRGPPLAEFGQFEFACREADRLQDVYADAVEGLSEARLACGEHGEVIGRLTGLIAADPLREHPRWLLMLALYRSGRHAEALDVYRGAREALDEIGLQPGPELRALEDAILRHAPSLAAPSARADMGAEALAAGASSAVGAGVSFVHVDEPVEGLGDGDDSPMRAPPRQTRKVVTALFCDVTGSTALGEELDPEALHGVMNRYFAELRAVIERHGGTVEKFIGDAVMAVFGIPRLHEDDALRAVRAAAEIRERCPRWPTRWAWR